MDEKELKTSPKQRFFIILIAILMLGSVIASYAAIVISGSGESSSGKISEAKTAEYAAAYEAKKSEFSEATKADFDRFIPYKSEIKAYNETSANEEGLKTKDLKTGSGKELKDSDTDYLAYYIGWCANEKVFDSSFDDPENPTGFVSVLEPSEGLIEGWKMGISKMKLGGIRELTIPSDLAYKDGGEQVCGANKPLKFIIMAVEKDANLLKLSQETQEANMRYQYAAQYGIDYDNLVNSAQ